MKQQIVLPRLLAFFMLLSLFVFNACEPDEQKAIEPELATELDPKIAQEWMQASYNTVKRTGLFALDASRVYAYTAVTMYESMVHGMPGYQSLSGQLQGLTTLPKPDPNKRYDWGMVLCHATPQVIAELTPGISSGASFTLFSLASRQEEEMRRRNGYDEEMNENSKEFGDQLASAIIQWSRGDRRTELAQRTYNVPSRVGNPQFYDVPFHGQFMLPYWWTSRPFVIQSHLVCQPDAPLAYSTDPNSDYYKEVKEVYDASFDKNKVDIGHYWANNAGASGSPAGSWVGIANQLVDQLKPDMATTLKMYVLLTLSTRDVFISCWYSKFNFNLQRPVTYIREVIGARDWVSPVPTPPYPDYTSGTSCNGGSSSTILTALYGPRQFTDNQHADKGFAPRTFQNFREAGVQAANSRVFGGVHMRRACEEGLEQGACVADYVMRNLKFESR
jgi:hypothetical protein